MRKAVLALAVLALAGCGSSGGKKPSNIESAIQGKQVETLFSKKNGLVSVADVTCTSAALAGNFDCTGAPAYAACARRAGPSVPCASPTAPTKIWISCFPSAKGSADAYLCEPENAPAGTHVFVTRAQRAAAKTASWKCLHQEGGPNGLDLGPVTISITKTYGPVETEPESMTKARAQALAHTLHLPFRGACG